MIIKPSIILSLSAIILAIDLPSLTHAAKESDHSLDRIKGWDRPNYKFLDIPNLFAPSSPHHEWSNWAETQFADPAEIYSPRKLNDLFAIVNQARSYGKKVRVAATGHSWSSSSVVNKEGYLISVIHMNKIFAPKHVGGDVWTVEVETGVTVKELDDFLRNNNPPLALPSNVVLDSVRYGGVIALGCHGAATHTRTIPDLVTEVKIVDSNGVLNTFSKAKDPQEFSAAVVNLGLLGVIYSYTIQVEPMFNLEMTDIHPLYTDYFSDPKIGGPKLKKIVLENDQSEIFYWPFNIAGGKAANDEIWIKQWKRTKKNAQDSELSDTLKYLYQNVQTTLGQQAYNLISANPSLTPFFTPILYSAVSADSSIVLHAPNAMHYQYGIDNLPCLDLEMSFKVDENFENVVKAWSFIVDLMYEYAEHDKYPLNLASEMRFVKSSSMLMSPAYDEDPEAIYCMIEILTVIRTPSFDEFSIKVAQYWMDNFQARPHWAKMWEHIPGIVPYLRKLDGVQYDKFENIRKKYDPKGMFMTGTFAGILGH
ncbi:hypothetical protein BGZ76_003975 [Entomortierella beljakovae]|nr:hypothetical protein BGZ76_003975 [Entomortierella beljakovae]